MGAWALRTTIEARELARRADDFATDTQKRLNGWAREFGSPSRITDGLKGLNESLVGLGREQGAHARRLVGLERESKTALDTTTLLMQRDGRVNGAILGTLAAIEIQAKEVHRLGCQIRELHRWLGVREVQDQSRMGATILVPDVPVVKDVLPETSINQKNGGA